VTRIVGRGWATVDLDRAATELAHLVERQPGFGDAPRSELLGARCRVGRAVEGEPEWIVLLEPDTEGRLAGFLARNGEGWAATWSAADADEVEDPGRPGPFGPERLLERPPTGGPFPLIVTAATIDP
jgi:hypothetical protein